MRYEVNALPLAAHSEKNFQIARANRISAMRKIRDFTALCDTDSVEARNSEVAEIMLLKRNSQDPKVRVHGNPKVKSLIKSDMDSKGT